MNDQKCADVDASMNTSASFSHVHGWTHYATLPVDTGRTLKCPRSIERA